jgi:hypothetical protein
MYEEANDRRHLSLPLSIKDASRRLILYKMCGWSRSRVKRVDNANGIERHGYLVHQNGRIRNISNPDEEFIFDRTKGYFNLYTSIGTMCYYLGGDCSSCLFCDYLFLWPYFAHCWESNVVYHWSIIS